MNQDFQNSRSKESCQEQVLTKHSTEKSSNKRPHDQSRSENAPPSKKAKIEMPDNDSTNNLSSESSAHNPQHPQQLIQNLSTLKGLTLDTLCIEVLEKVKEEKLKDFDQEDFDDSVEFFETADGQLLNTLEKFRTHIVVQAADKFIPPGVPNFDPKSIPKESLQAAATSKMVGWLSRPPLATAIVSALFDYCYEIWYPPKEAHISLSLEKQSQKEMNGEDWEQIIGVVVSAVEKHLAEFEYFRLCDEDIRQKQQHKFKIPFKNKFPHSTNDVTQFNYLFGERIKSEKALETKMNCCYNSCFVAGGQEKSFAPDMEKKEIAKKITIIIQARGVGKTHYLLSHAVTKKKPTIYIDLSKEHDKLLRNLSEEINKISRKCGMFNENSQFAEEKFTQYFFCKIIFFLGFCDVKRRKDNDGNAKRKLDFADFLQNNRKNKLEELSSGCCICFFACCRTHWKS